MHILISGGTGFIGSHLCPELFARGNQVSVLSRDPASVAAKCGSGVKAIASLDEIAADATIDAIVNLAGAPIAARRWSTQRKELLLSSRINITRDLVKLVERLDNKPACFISGSAVGFYGDQGDNEVAEDASAHDEFSHELCRRWEQAAEPVTRFGTRLCVVRTGLVLGAGGGFFKQMLWPFKLGLGGRIGDGKQWMPWIHMRDMVRLLAWLLEDPQRQGVYNATAPAPVTNVEFAQALAASLHGLAVLPLPAFILRLLLGEMAQLLLTGQKAIPAHALEEGFQFHYAQLKPALTDVLA